jgi:hypothetical protein
MNHLPLIDCNRKNPVMISSVLSVVLLATLSSGQLSMGQPLTLTDDHITIRKTATSVPGVPSPGHEDHQIVMALPPIDSGKVWVGKVSWVSSEPIEVGFLIGHNKSAEDKEHSHPATLQVNKSSNLVFASTNLTGSTPQQTFGNMDFVIDQLVFHSTNNRKFTVTYAIDADAKDVTKH